MDRRLRKLVESELDALHHDPYRGLRLERDLKGIGEGPCRVRTIGMGGVKSPGGAGEAEKS